jgi:hypothetical protein
MPGFEKDEGLIAILEEVTVETGQGLTLSKDASSKIGGHMRTVVGDISLFQRAIETLYAYGKVVRKFGASSSSEVTNACADHIIGLCKSFYEMLKRQRAAAGLEQAKKGTRFERFCHGTSQPRTNALVQGSPGGVLRFRLSQ